jgi:Na+/H+-dicarboxylate symporter
MKKIGLIPKLIIGLALGIIIGLSAPDWTVRLTETIRVLLGNLIKYFIPLIIVPFVAAGIAEFKSSAGKLLGFTVAYSYIDTVIACGLAAVAGFILVPGIASNVGEATEAVKIGKPFIEISMPPIMDVMSALLLSFVLGIGATWGKAETLKNGIIELRDIIAKIIRGLIIPIVPIFVGSIFAGVAAKGQLFSTAVIFGKMLVIIVVMQYIWLFIEYTIAGAYSKMSPIKMIKAMLPAYFTAFGTMSSAATMPIALESAKKVDYMDEEVADFVIPLCNTVHLAGAAMTITISAITVSLLTTGQMPPVGIMVQFIILLGVIEVGAVGVPGGSAMAALGILQSTLGFNEAALGLMLTLFMITDSFGTAANVVGDGSIAMIVNKKFGKQKFLKTEKGLDLK